MAEAAQQSDDWRDIHPAETQTSPYTHGDDWHDIAPPASLDEFAGPKITETPLYKAGEAVQKFGRETFPVSEEERAAHPYASAIGRGVGSMLPAVGGALVAGPAGALAGAAQMGMSAGADTFDDALAKGADEKTASKAAGIDSAIAMALGSVDLGAVIAPIKRSLPGWSGWAAQKLAQAGRSGLTFMGVGQAQQYLNTEVEKEIYNPDAHYSPELKDMLASFVVGGAFGTLHPLHSGQEVPGRPAEVPPLEGEVLPPERGPTPSVAGRDAPTIEGEVVGAPSAAEGRPEGSPPPARALPPPAETAPAATPQASDRASLEAMVKAGAPLDQIVAHPLVQEASEINRSVPPTGTMDDFQNPEWRASRVYNFGGEEVKGWDAAVDRLTEGAKAFSTQEPVANDRHAVIVVGPPASGKSSISEPFAQRLRAAIVDPDEAKQVIPEYRGGLATMAVHEESSELAKDVLTNLVVDGANLVIPKVGSNPDSIRRQMQKLQQAGYTVDIAHVAATPEIAGRRNIARFLETGRLVDPDYINEVGDKPRQTAYLLKGEANDFVDADTSQSDRYEIVQGNGRLAELLRQAASDRARGRENLGLGDRAGAGRGTEAPRQEDQVDRPHRVTAADGTAIDVAPRVVEADHVLTSQDQGYDPALQPRQRNRAASQAQVRDIATNLDPERLGYSAEADRGAPIVGPDGMVESGNGRVLALRRVYDQNGPQAQAYRDWLSRQGVDVSTFRNPILVRQRTTPFTPEQRRAFTVAANQPTTLAMSASERAMADARLIDTNSLNLIVNPDDLSRNHDFVRRFVGQLPQTEQGAMTDAHGALSSEGAVRVRNAVLAKAYGDAGILTRVAESTDDEIKSISNALVGAAPRWAKMRAGIESGAVRRDVDATPDVLEAVKRTADIRAKGQKFNEYLAQIDAFDKLPDTVEGFMRSFYDPKGRRAASAERIRDALRFYADEASKVSADKGLDLGLVKVEPRDILRLAQKKGWEGLPVGRPEEPDAGKMLAVANKVAGEWQSKLGPDIKVVMGGSLVSRTYVRSRADEPIDMDIRFLTDNPERDYPKVEAVTGLKLKKSRPMDNYPSGSAMGYLVEGPLTRDGITFDVEAAVRTPAYVGWARFYPAVMTPDELAAFRADKARLKGDKEAYKALKASTLKEVVKRVEERGGPWELERELYGRQGRDANRDGAGTGAGQPAGSAQAPGPFLTASSEGFGGEGAEGDQEAAVRAQRPERVIGPSLPGFEPVSSAEVAKRRANEPLRPRVAQEPPSGLFAHQGQQLSLEDFIDQVSDVKAQRPEAQTDTPQRETVLPFYSAVERAVSSAKQDKASPQQWLGMLKNMPGVKPEEMQWLGLEDWLKGQKGAVTKAQIADYVRANQIEVKDVEKAETPPTKDTTRPDEKAVAKYGDEWAALVAKQDAIRAEHPHDYWDVPEFAKNQGRMDVVHEMMVDDTWQRIQARGPIPSQAKFASYTTPGREPGSYRELLLTLPPKTDTTTLPEGYHLEKGMLNGRERYEVYGPGTYGPIGGRYASGDTPEQAIASFHRQHPSAETFKSPHFNEPNIIAHVRMDDRTIDGKKTLLVEEVQSDWMQKGKREGFRPSEAEYQAKQDAFKKQLEDITREISTHPFPSPERHRELHRMEAEITDQYNALHDAHDRGVPDAPFKTTWPELAMKRMIRYAAENGYDKIAWTSGETQAARYDLSKQISNLKVVRSVGVGGNYYTLDAILKGRNERQRIADQIPEKDLPDHIGKEMADRVVKDIDAAQNNRWGVKNRVSGNWSPRFSSKDEAVAYQETLPESIRTKTDVQEMAPKYATEYSGLDLKVGGEGMRGFYDQILPTTVNKLVKKYGAKVGDGKLPAAPGDVDKLYGIRRDDDGRYEVWERQTRDPVATFDTHDEAVREMARLGREQAKGVPIHVVDLTDKFKDVATHEGFPLFKTPSGWESAEGHVEPQGQKIRIGRDTYAYINPRYSAKEQEIANAVMEIGARMAPKANIKGVAALRMSGSPIWGGFINSAAFPQLITWSLEKGGAGQIGQTVRHEIIHHLRNMGLFSPDEWKALRDAAVHDGWLQRHNIYERYPDLSADHKVEEAVAEQFGKWRAERSLVKPGPIRDAFMRLDLFLRRVAAAARKVLGFNATPADIFTRIETGEVGQREPVKRASGGRVDTRKASHYSPTRGTRHRHCSICTMFRKPHACTAVSGIIAKWGSCDWFDGPVAERASGGRVKVDTTKDVRWMSEMDRSGTIFYRDRSLPARIINNGKWLSVDEPLKRHEVAEYNAIKKMIAEFEQKHGRKPNDAEREAIYLKCHKEYGEVAEHAYLRENGYDVKAWESWCRGKLAHLEHKRIAKPVPNPHVRPSPHDRRRLEATL